MELTSKHLRTYGRGWGYDLKADPCKCAAKVWYKFQSSQCSRNRGHGSEQAYCKQHAKQYECA